VVSYAKNLESSALPVGKDRTKEEGKVAGLASQGFNIPNDDNDNYVGYIMGNLLLPPRGIKDAESVGPCSQTFTVCTGQPNALEVSFGDPDLPEGQLDRDTAQRFFLGPGDLFRVPPGNCYRLHNHSRSHECLLTWTIIRPRHIANDGA
jgi:centromere protein C